jgi:hypothetical protein
LFPTKFKALRTYVMIEINSNFEEKSSTFFLSRKLIKDYGISCAFVYSLMSYEMETNNGFCFLIHSNLANALGLNRRTIARHVKTLVNNGYLIMYDYDPMIFELGNVYSAKKIH